MRLLTFLLLLFFTQIQSQSSFPSLSSNSTESDRPTLVTEIDFPMAAPSNTTISIVAPVPASFTPSSIPQPDDDNDEDNQPPISAPIPSPAPLQPTSSNSNSTARPPTGIVSDSTARQAGVIRANNTITQPTDTRLSPGSPSKASSVLAASFEDWQTVQNRIDTYEIVSEKTNNSTSYLETIQRLLE